MDYIRPYSHHEQLARGGGGIINSNKHIHCFNVCLYHISGAKKQINIIPSSCSYLLLKTPFYLISQSTFVLYLDSGLCQLVKELDNCNFTFAKPRNRPLSESNYKTFVCTGLFSLHIGVKILIWGIIITFLF